MRNPNGQGNDGLLPSVALLLNPEEAGEVLGVPRTRVYALIATGEIRSLKIGRSRRIPRTELERWIESQLELQTA